MYLLPPRCPIQAPVAATLLAATLPRCLASFCPCLRLVPLQLPLCVPTFILTSILASTLASTRSSASLPPPSPSLLCLTQIMADELFLQELRQHPEFHNIMAQRKAPPPPSFCRLACCCFAVCVVALHGLPHPHVFLVDGPRLIVEQTLTILPSPPSFPPNAHFGSYREHGTRAPEQQLYYVRTYGPTHDGLWPA